MYHRPDRTLMADLLFLRCYSFSHLQIIAFLKRPLKNLIEPPLGTLPKKVQHYLNVSMVGLHLHDVRCRGNSSRLPSGDNRLHLRTSKSTPKKSFSSASFSALPPSSSQTQRKDGLQSVSQEAALTRHCISRHFDLGLPSIQN
uniref:Uncharacterized protein n=1 Tax=Molossus molossus TaxID=27622 RepID=A0A7J8J098_MOLMO|nr:hypothetical protein HJG59_010333 [Molossus molossus]